jgi:subfamily B ATP-binding cassette protein MsbA
VIEFWLKLWRLTRPYKTRFIIGAIFGALSGLGETLVIATVVFVLGVVFSGPSDTGIAGGLQKLSPGIRGYFLAAQQMLGSLVHGSNAGILIVVSLVPLAVLFRGVCNYLSSYLMGWVASRAISDLRVRLFEHLLNLPMSFLSKNSTGELMSRISDIGLLQNMIGASLVTIIREPINIISLGWYVFRLNPTLMLEALITLPLCAIPVIIYNKKVRKSAAEIQNEQARLAKMMHEAFTGIRIIKGYNMERVVVDRYRETQKKYISHFMRVVRSTETPGPIIETLGAIGIALLLFHVAGSNQGLQFGAFVIGLLAMYRPIKATVRVQSDLHRARAATDRVFELMATQSTLMDPAKPQPLKAAGSPIHFENVSFSYPDSGKSGSPAHDKVVLHNVELRVEPGQMLALVGRSGSGKTTLTNLLLRFYDPTEGAITIGGVDLRQAAMGDLRSQMAVVTQEVILFNDTIRNNIAVGRPGASIAEIEDAAKHAFAHEFIMEKPHGYDSVVGEKGTNLSGGQRQRIAIARAILKNAPILVLDEATSSLDTHAERAVQSALDALMKGRTTICIAHRLSTIQHADRIIVMDNGQIVESGKHAELLLTKGVYQKLHALGFDT